MEEHAPTPAPAEPQQQLQEMRAPRVAEAPLKKEFLKPLAAVTAARRDTRDDRDGGAEPNGDAQVEGEGDEAADTAGASRRKRGTFKKRPIDANADPADTLCRPVAAGGMCAFGDSCKFSHDIDDYMKRKEKDLGAACPVFTAFGFCRYGVACRFAHAHLERDDGKYVNVDTRPADQRREDRELLHERNAMTDRVRQLLRKNRYPFHSAEQGKKGKGSRHSGKAGGGRGRDAAMQQHQQLQEQTEAGVTANVKQGEGKEISKTETVDELGTSAAPATEEVDVKANDQAAAHRPEPEAAALAAPATCDPVERSGVPLIAERKPIDFKRKIYVAPLTTVGNLPFRRLLKQLGADITCGEMAMATNLLKAQQSEWALLRRHESEDVFGVQLAGAHGDQMARACELLARETDVDFIDINMGCPIDIVCRAGAGSALMTRPPRLMEVIAGALTGLELGHAQRGFGAPPGLTVKLRTGWTEKAPVAHKLITKIQGTRASTMFMNASVVQDYKLRAVQGVDAITVHGRSRLQRYTRNADWDYVFHCSDAQDPELPRVPFVGGGDVLSFEEFDEHLKNGKLETCMIARGALIKPWLPTEIKERRHWDISSSERLDQLKDFVRFGLEHWGSDQKGVNRTRRYLLEWQSFLCRYIPVGLLEVLPQKINHRPQPYYGRDDLETLMASDQAVDWIKISEILLGPVPSDFRFQPKHKANSYATA